MTEEPFVPLSSRIDDAKCFDLVRQHRWPDGVRCPTCGRAAVTRQGREETQPNRQRYRGKDCDARVDDVTDPSFAGQPRPLRTWVLCLYVMGLNRSNRQIAPELALSVSEVQVMTEPLRSGLVVKLPPVTLDDDVEVDEVYGGAGHKGNPAAVAKKQPPRTVPPAPRSPRPGHPGEGDATEPRPDPARVGVPQRSCCGRPLPDGSGGPTGSMRCDNVAQPFLYRPGASDVPQGLSCKLPILYFALNIAQL
jgi:transposase-like protein